jgi:hypothetical protein
VSIQAKFRCEKVVSTPGADEVDLSVVTVDRPENKTWSAFTPSGKLALVITNPAALGAFKAGEEYLITIEKAAQ